MSSAVRGKPEPVRRMPAGRVRSVKAVRREVRIATGPAWSQRLREAPWVWVVWAGGRELRCRVISARDDGAELLVTFAPGVTRDSVGEMKGARVDLEVPERDAENVELPPPAELSGMTVQDEAGNVLGTVTDVYATNMNGVMEIRKVAGGRMRLPVIAQVIVALDEERGRVVVGDIAPYAVEDED